MRTFLRLIAAALGLALLLTGGPVHSAEPAAPQAAPAAHAR